MLYCFKKVVYEPLKHFDFVDPQVLSCRSPYQTRKILDHLQIKIVKFNPQRNRNFVVPNVFSLSKHNLYHIINQHFGHVLITTLKLMMIKGLMKGSCLLTKATKITKGPDIDVSETSPGFLLQIYFDFLNVERIYGFTST